MHHKTTQHPIQQLNNGQNLEITEHVFEFSSIGPKLYLQANLHGSEVFGTFLLGRIINRLKSLTQVEIERENLSGSVVIVPTANPIAAQNTVYNSMTGRWNPISGTNWNRIFDTQEFGSRIDLENFYQNQLTKANVSIECLLAARLMLLAKNADFIIDIHTTGRETVPHIFSHQDHAKCFKELEPEVNIYTTNNPPSPSFENSNVWPLINSSEIVPVACTWEASNHSVIDFEQIQVQEERLWNWLKNACSGNLSKEYSPKISILDTELNHLVAPFGGYFSWVVDKGEIIKKGQNFAIFYQPHEDKFIEAKAEFDFVLIGKYGIGAISQGDQIGLIGRL